MKKSVRIIHITGASGSGVSSLGAAFSSLYGYKRLDTDDYFWVMEEPLYTIKRDVNDRIAMLDNDIRSNEKCVISGSLSGWGDVFIPRFDIVVFLYTPSKIRLERLAKREYEKFGGRIMPGGDMYEAHLEFMEWAGDYDSGGVDMRSLALHNEWLNDLECPVIRADGTEPSEKIAKDIMDIYA